MTKLIQPKIGNVYTAQEVLNALDLRDIPHLHFVHEKHRVVIQNSHLTYEELLTVPGFAETQWKYRRTTDEWIPIFDAVSVDEVLKCVDIEPWVDPYDADAGFWVTPKGFPRPQYYKRNEDGVIVRYDGVEIHVRDPRD